MIKRGLTNDFLQFTRLIVVSYALARGSPNWPKVNLKKNLCQLKVHIYSVGGEEHKKVLVS